MNGRIVYHCTARHRYTLDRWFDVVAEADGMPEVTIETYEDVRDDKPPAPGTHVFTDQDRLTAPGMHKAVALARRVATCGPGHAVVNWPNFVLGRSELLRVLHAAGQNQFRCYRLDERPVDLRFPIFLRIDHAHDGPATPLLQDAAALTAAVRNLLVQKGERRDDILILEFVDTDRIDGNFVKYSAYCVLGEVFPANMVVATDWTAKSRFRVTTDAAYDAEIAYVRSNPHAKAITEVFRLARADFGRIDYGLKDGRLQVFEINTNPDLMSGPSWGNQERRRRFLIPFQVPAIRATFQALAAASNESALQSPAGTAHGIGAVRNLVSSIDAIRRAAAKGEVRELMRLGALYREGYGVPLDYVEAYKLFDLAASRCTAVQEAERTEARRAQKRLERRLSPQQLAAAQSLARVWTQQP